MTNPPTPLPPALTVIVYGVPQSIELHCPYGQRQHYMRRENGLPVATVRCKNDPNTYRLTFKAAR